MSAWDHLHHAALELVRATPLKQRLVVAYRRHLALIVAEQLPADMREPFLYVMRSLQAGHALRHEDVVVASVRKMSVQDAEECATLIVEMLGALTRRAQGERSLSPA